MAEDSYFYLKAGARAPVGPHTRDEVGQLLLNGTLCGSDYVWREGEAKWARVDEVQHVFLGDRLGFPPVPPDNALNEGNRPPDVPPPLPTALVQTRQSFLREPSVRGLLIANAVTLGIALFEQWPIVSVLWVYWCQSVIIGVFNALRMATLRHFSTDGLTMNDRKVPTTRGGKMQVTVFFVIHYGFFHAVYFFFIGSASTDLEMWDFGWVFVGAALFAINHYRTYRRIHEEDLKGRPNLGTMMFLPYARVVPMHLCIGFGVAATQGGAGNWAVLTFFMLLKTAADIVMEVVERRMYRRSARKGMALEP